MTTFSRSTFPPNGWVFRQPQIGWSAPTPLGSTFGQTVDLIIKARRKNPVQCLKFNLSLDPVAVGDELEAFTRTRLGLGGAVPDPKVVARRPLPQAVAAGVAGVKKIASGAALLLDWEESGQSPVPPGTSNERAALCAQCPKNTPGDYTKWFTQPVSDLLKKKLGRLHGMNLKTDYDEKLQVCSACLCPLKLKVHTPINLILSHLSAEARADLWPQCWILSQEAQSKS